MTYSAHCLSMLSPFFRKAICGDFKESAEKRMEVDAGDDQSLFEKMIALACGCKVTVTRMCHLVDLASMADKYQMDKMVVDALEGCIVRNLDVDHCCKLLAWAFDSDSDHFPLAKTAVRNMALVRFEELSLSERFGELSENVLKAIIQHPKVQADEQMLQQAVMLWCSEHCGALRKFSMEVGTPLKPVSERLRVHLLFDDERDAFVSNDEVEFISAAFDRNEFLWRHREEGPNIPLHCEIDGLVYAAMEIGEVLVMDAFNLDKLHVLNVDFIRDRVSSIAVWGEFLLLGDSSGMVYCYDRLHGELISYWTVDDPDEFEVCCMKTWGQHLLVACLESDIRVYNLSDLPKNSERGRFAFFVGNSFQLWNGRVLFFSRPIYGNRRHRKCVKVYAIGAANNDEEAILPVHEDDTLMVLSLDKLYIGSSREHGEISEWALGTWERQRTFSPWQMLRDLHFDKVDHDFSVCALPHLVGSQMIFVGARPGVPISQPFIEWVRQNPTKGFIGVFDMATSTFTRVVLLDCVLFPKLMVYGDIWA